MIGIYKIENLINGKCYIGQSVDIQKRWKAHKNSAFNTMDKSYNYPLYKALRKYSLENFSFEILEECLIQELNEKEKYFIKKYDSFFNGYNQTLGGDTSKNINKENIIGIISDLENTSLKHKEIAEKWNVSQETVQGINTGRYWKYDREYPIQARYSYLGKDKDFVFSQNHCVDCGKEINKKSTRCDKCEREHRKIPLNEMAVTREELKNLIRTKSFTQIGKQFNVSDNTIRKWCDKFNLPRKKSDIKNISDIEWENI